MAQNLEFKSPGTSKDSFQNEISKDIKNIRSDNKLYIPADKTTNTYKVSLETYDNLLNQNIQKDYKKTTVAKANTLLKKDIKIAKNLDLDDRIEVEAKSESYITLKDHKDEFRKNPKCRLINPNKSNIGKVSKQILQKINNSIRSTQKLSQWRSTQDVILWFKDIPNKNKQHFIQFDICEFYPSISVELLSDALGWASNVTKISTLDREVIMAAKNTLLYNSNSPWCKKTQPDFFDVTMGSYDGAETCEIVGLFILSKLKLHGIDLGLYRDDGLACSAKPKREIDNIKKKIQKTFNDLGLNITIEANSTFVDFLDVTFDLKTGLYKPFLKPNNTLQYVHTSSNHPKHIIENIPKGVEKRLSMLSSNEDIFRKAIPPYQEALNKAGHTYNLSYRPPPDPQQQPKRRNRKRKILWFNPPFSKTVKTKIGKQFFDILDKCFPPSNPLSKIFNRHTVKLSYSCMPNIEKITSGHNKKLLKKGNPPQRNCSCRDKNNCPVQNKCLTNDVIYQATVTRQDNQKTETYIGLTARTFKERWNTHKTSFRLQSHQTETKLSTYIWDLKQEGVDFELTWRIVAKTTSYSPSTKKCWLCTKEKYFIIYEPNMASLNKRHEFFTPCPHKSKYKLCNQKFPT